MGTGMTHTCGNKKSLQCQCQSNIGKKKEMASCFFAQIWSPPTPEKKYLSLKLLIHLLFLWPDFDKTERGKGEAKQGGCRGLNQNNDTEMLGRTFYH